MIEIPLQFDGTTFKKTTSDLVANKKTIVESGTTTTIYEAIAPIGTAQATAKWMAWKKVIDESVAGTTTITITWADGNSNFDNVATDLTALTYS